MLDLVKSEGLHANTMYHYFLTFCMGSSNKQEERDGILLSIKDSPSLLDF